MYQRLVSISLYCISILGAYFKTDLERGRLFEEGLLIEGGGTFSKIDKKDND